MKWNEKQTEAIEKDGKNMLVAAAAGSGKTAVLVERITRTVIEKRVPVDRLLVVTFTNKAAAEMKERLVGSLKEAVKSEKNAEKAAFMRTQLNSIYKANISTFHSFALSVIRRYYYVAGIDPGFAIADDGESAIMQQEAADALVRSRFANDGEAFSGFLDRYAGGRNLEAFKEGVRAGYGKLRSIPDTGDWMKKSISALGTPAHDFENSELAGLIKREALKRFELSAARYDGVASYLDDLGLSRLGDLVRGDSEGVRALSLALETNGFDGLADAFKTRKTAVLRATAEEKLLFDDETKKAVTKMRETAWAPAKSVKDDFFAYSMAEYVSEMNETQEYADYYCGLLDEFGELYGAEKRKAGLADFSDIEHMALAVLSDKAVADEYRKKIEYIFIDEYQDSNLLQERLIDLIKRENNVFMVGDVKQSIYKFRLAEPEIFLGKYEKFRSGADPDSIKVDLNENFRSKKGVIDAVNEVFRASMAGYDEDAELHQGTTGEGSRTKLVVIANGDEPDCEEKDDIAEEIAEMKSAEKEAVFIAQAVQEAVRDGYANKDIAVLMRSVKGRGELTAKILSECGIPSYMDEGEGYFDTVEIDTVMNLLRLTDNSRQDIPLLAVLTSPAFGFDAEMLAKIRIFTPRGSYNRAFAKYAEAGDDKCLSAKCRDTIDKFAALKTESRTMPLSDFIWKLINDTGYYVYAGGLPAGGQRQANLRALADKALTFRDGAGTIGDFIQYVDNLKNGKVNVGQTKTVSENDDVVRIMTIHASKGLQYPVVIVAGLGSRFNKDKSTLGISIHKDVGLGMTLADPKQHTRKSTIVKRLADMRSAGESSEEELRVLYVAMTRAQERLVLIGSTGKTAEKFDMQRYGNPADLDAAGCFLDIIAPAHFRAENSGASAIDMEITGADALRSFILSEDENAAALREVASGSDGENGFSAEIERRMTYEYPYAKELALKSKYSVSELVSEGADEYAPQMTEFAKPLFISGRRALTAAERGTLYHAVFEKIDFAKADKAGYAEELIADLVSRELMLPEEAAAIEAGKVTEFMGSDIGKRMAKAAERGELHRETPFTMRVEKDGTDVYVQGIIDCWFREGDSCILVDYKTNRAANEADEKKIAEHYRKQLELYAEALKKCEGIDVTESYLYLISKGKELRLR